MADVHHFLLGGTLPLQRRAVPHGDPDLWYRERLLRGSAGRDAGALGGGAGPGRHQTKILGYAWRQPLNQKPKITKSCFISDLDSDLPSLPAGCAVRCGGGGGGAPGGRAPRHHRQAPPLHAGGG